MLYFHVVLFPEENDAMEVIPSTWINQDGTCFWPTDLSPERRKKKLRRANHSIVLANV